MKVMTSIFRHRNKTASYYWIGLNDIGTENNYKWSDGTAYGIYLDWAYHQPDDYKGQEDCMELLKRNGKWNDDHCSVQRSYICKSYNGKI